MSIILGAFVYNFEHEVNPEYRSVITVIMTQHDCKLHLFVFSSIPAGIWWAFITMTTVGYGDIFPITGWGKGFLSILIRILIIITLVGGVVASIVGIVCMSLPLPAIVQNFHHVYAIEAREKHHRQILRQLQVNRMVKQSESGRKTRITRRRPIFPK